MDIIKIYTDGSCFNSDRFKDKAWFCGAGVVFKYGSYEKRSKICLGKGTNNVGELYAIRHALQSLKVHHLDKHVNIYTDSKYAIGSITKNWNSKKNVELIRDIKRIIKEKDIINLTFIWVRGHDGNLFNELADSLAAEGRELGQIGMAQETLYKDNVLVDERTIQVNIDCIKR